MHAISPARTAAFGVLESVSNGAYASDVVRRASASLSPRDAALARQIVFGCLRYQAQLDYLITVYSGKPADRLDDAVAIALRAGIFQMRYLERIPPHAAVHNSVEFVKRRKRAASGLANAVLRKVNRLPIEWPDLATELSCPSWLLARWSGHFSEELARRIAGSALAEPVPYIRVPPTQALPAGLQVEATNLPGAYRLLSAGTSNIRLHDIGSQSIVPLLDLKPGLRYLDLCAAPGNKTVQALETPLALAIACDVSPDRIRDIPPVCPRVVLDATEPLPFAIPFDRIFIDAPCSGTGTLGRNPEIKWRLKETDLPRFAEKQLRIARQAAGLLASGGKLVYATCSLEQEENEDVVRALLKEEPGLRCEREIWRIPGRDEGDGFFAAVLKKEPRT
ncbi:MAG TPA: transcription antitermination factor NusB [Bryobacteraceae bacterium]